jgi:phosphoglycolate phosphatase-like HAD superfamily hydrolase
MLVTFVCSRCFVTIWSYGEVISHMSDDVLVLWDIDGTLLNSGGAGRDLYDEVFSSLFGRPLEARAPMAGRTDRAFILETLELAGIDEPRRYVDPFMAALATHAQAVHATVAAQGEALPGAADVLTALAAARSVGWFAAFGTDFPGLFEWAAGAPAAAEAGVVPVVPAAGAPVPVPARAVQTIPLPAATAPLSTVPVAALPGTPAGGVQTVLAPTALAQVIPAQAAARPVASHRTAARPVGAHRLTAHPVAAHPVAPRTAAPRRAARRIYQSVLTGNIRAVAETKLAALGLRDGLDLCIGAYGEDHEDRTELVHVARRRAAGVHGRSATAFAGTSTVVVGNTPLDVSAALSAGARAVGVATGAYSAAELRAAGAHAIVPDLTDTGAVLRALLG